MPLVNFSNLDFDQIKTSLKDYVKSNTNFTDYDFEGSNLSTIIDLLAYNTYISSYNANMVSNEVFLDSATLRENIVSIARNTGYVPRSVRSAVATVSFECDVSNTGNTPASLTLKKGIVASTAATFGNFNYTFILPEDVTTPVVNNVAYFSNIKIYEGSQLNAQFTVDTSNKDQKFILDNPNIDTSLITCSVRNTEESTGKFIYKLTNNLFGVTDTSQVFFIQETANERYQLLFGDGIFGKKLDNLNFIDVDYVISNGENGNGINDFSFAGRLVDSNGTTFTESISPITTITPSYNGQSIETVESVRKFAPRMYSAQNRAVTTADYEAIVPRIYNEAESVTAYGGEDLDPPRFGEVYISIKPTYGNYVPDTVKNNLVRELKKYSVASVRVNLLDLKYLYVEYDTVAYYNSNLAPDSAAVKTKISTNLEKYADSSSMNQFGAKFKYSEFLNVIDKSDSSITSNISNVKIRRNLLPTLNKFVEYELCFGNSFYVGDRNGYNIKTSGFKVNGIADTVYITDRPIGRNKSEVPTKGRLFLFRLDAENEPVILSGKIGTIDYVKGEVNLTAINIISTLKITPEPLIEVSATPVSNDVIAKQDLFLQLDNSNSKVNMEIDQVSSGTDISGSNYVTTPSYSSGSLVRY